ncbi:hypothetical protein [Mariprofundus sp. KV]|uniref:hypothetical protein n=1 Tax=Mariprofundus sp. KV TaxID=2608715 RepID=UPI0015A11468|nr:hypothetical protein [Mariprofundus sp. KV]NWF37497.1 hypothetical protein [Mariprofundus sp. KV]
MRKVLALFLTATLLCVSSVPALAEAASCLGPELVASMTMGDEHEGHHDGGLEAVHLGHDHRTGLQGDWQKDRIECGCGCHNSIDSLPHLLAPHNIDTALFQMGVDSVAATTPFEPVLLYRTARIPVPPPQLIS